MSELDFFQEIEHTPVTWRQHKLHVPLFYSRFYFMTISILTHLERIRNLLPSTRLKPYRISPWHSILSITAYQYQESDIGSYNEVGIGIPVTLDEETPLFTGVFRKSPKVPMSYTHYLPVTTEVAREVGVEFAGYPKFIADIKFIEEDNWIACELKTDDKLVLKLKGRKLALKKARRFRVNPLTFTRGHILRSEFVISERKMGFSKRSEDVNLMLGEHQIADELRGLQLGRVLSYGYCPQAQGILTPVIESFAG